MKKGTLALDFAQNAFGNLRDDIKDRLMAVIENPCQETWEDAYSIVLNWNSRNATLWNALLLVDPDMPTRKPLDEPWPYIPSSEMIIKGINQAVFNDSRPELQN